ALAMPPRPPGAERGSPGRLPGPGSQPDLRVEWVLLPGAGRIAAALREEHGHRRRVEPRHRPEPGVGRPREIKITFQVVQRPALCQPAGKLLDDPEGHP